MNKNTIEQQTKKLLSRGVEEIIDREHLIKILKSGKKLRIKFGIDPTSPFIHLGRAIPLRKLRDFQRLGHTIVLIIGDFTATIGDPSDKLAKRPMLSKEQVQENFKNYKKQIEKIISLDGVEFHYNSAWLEHMTTKELLELAESFSLQQISARRNFQERIDRGEEVSLREALYPIFQGYDSVVVQSDVEVGGLDQLFNLLAGRTVQKHLKQPQQDIFITPMLEGIDGRKMSSSWGNIITIIDAPQEMFGKIMSLRDELLGNYFLLCTDVSEEEIHNIEQQIQQRTLNPRDAKLRLAEEIVSLYHNTTLAKDAKNQFIKTFSKKEVPENIPNILAQKEELLIDFLTRTKLTISKSSAKRLIESGAVELDGEKIQNPRAIVRSGALRIGKTKFIRVVAP